MTRSRNSTHGASARRRALAAGLAGLAICLAAVFVAAQSGVKPAIPDADMLGGAKSADEASAPTSPTIWSVDSPDFPRLNEELQRRMRQLDERERQLNEREIRLRGLEADIKRQIQEKNEAERRLQEAYGRANKDLEKRLKAMAPAYEGMKPENAAMAMSGLKDSEALRLLQLMETKKVAKILDAMAEQDRKQETTRAIDLTKALQELMPEE